MLDSPKSSKREQVQSAPSPIIRQPSLEVVVDGISGLKLGSAAEPTCTHRPGADRHLTATVMASPSLTSIIEEDVGEFIALASLAAARRLVLVAKTTRAPALRHIRTVLCRIEGEEATVNWIVAAAYDEPSLAFGHACELAGLPRWDALRRTPKEYSLVEWAVQKPAFEDAVKFAVRLPRILCAVSMTGGTLRQIIAVRHAILHLAEHIGCTLAVQARLQRFEGAPADFARDRDELAAAIRDWTAQAAQADEPVTGSFSVLGLPRQRLRGFKPRTVEWARPIPAEGVVVGRAMTLALHRACGTLQRGELAAALREEVTAALEPLAESGTASAASRLRARASRAARLCTRRCSCSNRVPPSPGARTRAGTTPRPAEAEAAEAEEEASTGGALVEEAPLCRLLRISPSRASGLLRLARGFLHGPNRSRSNHSLYALAVALEEMLLASADGRELRASTGAGSSLSSRGTAPLRGALLAMQQTQAPAGRAAAGHVCSPSCITSNLSRALLAELMHLHRHCAGSGVSAFPEDEMRLHTWTAFVEGPEGTPWQDRRVRCTLRFCPACCGGEWPNVAPKLIVNRPVPHHPNIDPCSGAVCMDLLRDRDAWSCAGGVRAILLSFRSLLASPHTSDAASMPANLAAAADMLGRPEAYRETNETIALGMQWGTHARQR